MTRKLKARKLVARQQTIHKSVKPADKPDSVH